MPYFEDYYDYDLEFDNNRDIKLEVKDSTLKLEGEGSIRVAPNLASAFIGVVTENKELTAAQKENALKTDKVIASLLNLGVEEKDIKTENFSITPEYDFVEGKQIFRGYRVSNNLRITIRDINKIGTVIDTAVANGANAVYNVNFSLSNKEAVYKRALALAIKNAVDKAKSVERTLAVIVDEIPIEITEQDSDVNIGRTALYEMKSPAAETTIKSGEIEVTAKVRAVFVYTKISA
jgi:uncharacterized protein YggE